jgi:hypothetical protein
MDELGLIRIIYICTYIYIKQQDGCSSISSIYNTMHTAYGHVHVHLLCTSGAENFGIFFFASPSISCFLLRSLTVNLDASIIFGRPLSRLTSFRIFLAVNGSDWRTADCGQGQGIQCSFDRRDSDLEHIVSTRLSPPEYARFVRIVPAEWEPDMLNANAEVRIGIVGTPDISVSSSRYGTGDHLDYLVLSSGSPGDYWLEGACNRDSHESQNGRWGSAQDSLGKVQCCLFPSEQHVCTRDGCLSGYRYAV